MTTDRQSTPDLPATRSRAARTYDPEELASGIQELAHQLLGDGPFACSKINSGVSSLNYLVTHAAGHHLFRIDLFRDLAEVLVDLQLARDAARWGVTTQPDALHVGHLCSLPTIVRPFILGRALEPASPADAHFVSLAGRQLGLLHMCPVRPDRRWFYAEAVGEPTKIRAGSGRLQDQARAIVSDNIDLVAEGDSSRRGLVHTDFKSDNLIRSDGRVHVIDWEKATTGAQLFDLGMALFHLIALEDQATAWSRAHAFISGYRATNPLASHELDIAPDLVAYAASIFFLVDAEINERGNAKEAQTDLDSRHSAYYANYCVPAFERLLARRDELHGMAWTS